MGKIIVTQLKDDLYLLDDNHEATGYLVIGNEKALVVDTMNGSEDLKALVRDYTDKPIIVVNTHGHPDHIWGNVFFDKAYMNLVDMKLAEEFINDPESKAELEKNGLKFPPFEDIHGGQTIDLGGKTVEIIDAPGHTPGGILLLLKEDRILFTGDSINHHLWMQLDHCLSIEDTIKEFDKLLYLENDADYILHGHARGFDDISLIHCVRDGLIEIFEGKSQEDTPYNWFGGVDVYHPFKCVEGKHYMQEDHGICYSTKNIKN